MKRCMGCVWVLLLAGTLVSCGGGGGDGGSPSGTAPAATQTPTPTPTTTSTPTPTPTPTPAATPGRFEESDVRVTLSPGDWIPADSKFGWSGGTAVRSTVTNATVQFTFSGRWVTWIGERNTDAGIAEVSVDGGPARRVDLFARPQEARTPIVTLHDLSPGQHTLTIRVTGEKNDQAAATSPAVVVVDAFDVEAPIVSHMQENDPAVVYSGTWTPPNLSAVPDPCVPDPSACDPFEDHSANWSGGALASAPEPPRGGARFTTTAGDKLTLTFRGTSIAWQSGRGPDFGIATVELDGAPTDIDTYFPAQIFQDVVFKATGLADATHTLTITATGRKNDASTGTKIVVDAFDVTTPGRRFQEDDLDPKTGLAATTYTGTWVRRNINRVWSEGAANTSDTPGSRAKFTFTGTGVSYIGCQKNSIGRVNIYLDGSPTPVATINNFKRSPVEAFQKEIYRVDGLSPGRHTLEVEDVDTNSFIVVDAFDVRP